MKELGNSKHIGISNLRTQIARSVKVHVECVKNQIRLSQRQFIDEILRTLSFHEENNSAPNRIFVEIRSFLIFSPPTHWKFDAYYLNKIRYFLCRINALPILFQPRSKTLDIGSKNSSVVQNFSRFRSFPEL